MSRKRCQSDGLVLLRCLSRVIAIRIGGPSSRVEAPWVFSTHRLLALCLLIAQERDGGVRPVESTPHSRNRPPTKEEASGYCPTPGPSNLPDNIMPESTTFSHSQARSGAPPLSTRPHQDNYLSFPSSFYCLLWRIGLLKRPSSVVFQKQNHQSS